MSYENLTPEQAKKRLDAGWTYVDVRTIDEFEGGHVPDSYNVPFAEMNRELGGMQPNEHFVSVMKKHFAPDAKIVLGCAAGGRSRAACEVLAREGYTSLANMHGGFSGQRDPNGRTTQPGWSELGYPVAQQAPAERSYSSLRGR